jgi:small-conductance mechanosensitive channel
MYAPISWTRAEQALAQSRGWIELGIIAACLIVGALVARRAWQRRGDLPDVGKLTGGIARVVFPLTTLALMLLARVAFRHSGTSYFLDIAVPLITALAAIRVFVYGMRQLFRGAAWLKASERTVAFAIWGLVVLHYLNVLPEFAEELDAFVIPIGRNGISLLTILKGAAAVALTLVVTLWISGFLEQRIMATRLDANLRVMLVKVLRAALLTVGVLVALDSIGFDLTLLTVFGGALGVGIGLGLQKLASNYIAGFTILLDRSIRLNDMVSVGDRTGVVTKLTSRYVVVRGLDGIDAIVPNETLVTSVVLNHSHTTREIRVGLPVQVAYGSDVDKALALMEAAGRAEPRVMQGATPPTALLTGFGDNGINLELGIWIRDPELGHGVLRSAINRAIWASFRENGIAIPYPQREVRLLADPPASARPGPG